MRKILLALFALLAIPASTFAHEPRELTFPGTDDGRKIIAIDLHTHSVFSDGHVWPTVRVWEAERDGLAAYAVTEHLEYQPHADDIPHPDRNRSYELARDHIDRRESNLLVIPGVEITRPLPPGHVNAVFVQDANTINVDSAEQAIMEANRQGAFLFWNHPYWSRDFKNGIVELTDYHRQMIEAGQLHGIEVANGDGMSEEALAIALDHDLAVLGVSDIHGLIDYDYDIPAGEQRTSTLIAVSEITLDNIKQQLTERKTVALFKGNMIGREPDLRLIVDAMLSMEVGEYGRRGSTIVSVTLKNEGPIALRLRHTGDKSLANASDLVVVPARGTIELRVRDVDNVAELLLPFEVLNAITAPNQNLSIGLVEAR